MPQWPAKVLEPGNWPTELQIALFNVLWKHKPAGLDGHFQMIQIFLELRKKVPDITPAHIWAHLATMYDVDALGEAQTSVVEKPPVVGKGRDHAAFSLPADGFGDELVSRGGEVKPEPASGGRRGAASRDRKRKR